MSNIELMYKILSCTTKEEIMILLDEERVPLNKSKYC